MLDGLTDNEIDLYLDEHPKIVSLFKVDVADVVMSYITHWEDEFDELNREAIRKLRQAQESLEWEMVICQRVKASNLEEVDLGTTEVPRPVNVTKEMPFVKDYVRKQ